MDPTVTLPEISAMFPLQLTHYKIKIPPNFPRIVEKKKIEDIQGKRKTG